VNVSRLHHRRTGKLHLHPQEVGLETDNHHFWRVSAPHAQVVMRAAGDVGDVSR
jgi:hypothetical protein